MDAERSEEGPKKNTAGDYRIIEEDVFWLKGRSAALSKTPPPPKPAPVRRPAHVARQLALAHHLQRAIERGLVADQAALARKLGLTRARGSQLFDLLMLAADLQEQVLVLEAVDGAEPMAERTLRAMAHAGTWAEQRAAWGHLRGVPNHDAPPSLQGAWLTRGMAPFEALAQQVLPFAEVAIARHVKGETPTSLREPTGLYEIGRDPTESLDSKGLHSVSSGRSEVGASAEGPERETEDGRSMALSRRDRRVPRDQQGQRVRIDREVRTPRTSHRPLVEVQVLRGR